VCYTLAWSSERLLTQFHSGWSLEAPDHAVGRLLQRVPGTNLSAALFQAGRAFLAADWVSATKRFGNASNLYLPAASGAFGCNVIACRLGARVSCYARARTWLSKAMLPAQAIAPATAPADTVLMALLAQQDFAVHPLHSRADATGV
jgi:hypothetical protein